MFMMNCLYEDNTRVMGTGKGHQMLFKDLTTLQGVLNRIKRYNLNDNRDFIIQKGQTVYDLKIIYIHRGKNNE